eukprot:g2475.t1
MSAQNMQLDDTNSLDDLNFAPTIVTAAMRNTKGYESMKSLLDAGLLDSWVPGFKGGHISSQVVFIHGVDDSADILTSADPSDRDWGQLLEEHSTYAYMQLSEIMAELDSEGKYINVCNIAQDAQDMHLKHPETFEAPTAVELRRIKPGDHVKVCLKQEGEGAERLWVVVAECEPGSTGMVYGRLANDPLFLRFDCGDRIAFKKCHIYTCRCDAGPRRQDNKNYDE